MSGELILVIHRDPDIRTQLSSALHGVGFKVMSEASAESARDRLEQSPFFDPDVVLAPIGDSGGDGDPVLGEIRARRGTSVPVVVLADTADGRRRALRQGYSHILGTSADPEEVVLTTRLALDRHRDDDTLSGSLGQMSAAELLQTAEVNRRSGVVTLRNRARTGTVWLREGRIVDAEIDDGRRREEAVYAMASWDEGSFEASFRPISVPERIEGSTTGLLLEAMRRRDEARRDEAPHAALPDPPPAPPRRLLAVHRALTLLNTASAYATEHATEQLIAERLEAIRCRLVDDHGSLALFGVTPRAQIHVVTDAESLDRADPARLIQASAGWLKEMFAELDDALPGAFPLERLRMISEANHTDLSSLGFYQELGLESDPQEVHTR